MIDIHIMNKTYAITEEEAVKAGREWEKRLLPQDVTAINAGDISRPENAVKLVEGAWKRIPLTTADIAVTVEGFADTHKPPKPKKTPAYQQLDLADAHFLRHEAEFVERVHGIKVLGTTNALHDVKLELPSFLPDAALVKRYMDAVLPGAEYTPLDAKNPALVSVSLYDFKDTVTRMQKPLAHRTLLNREKSERRPLEQEYAHLMGFTLANENARIKEGQTLKETIHDLKKRRRIDFKPMWRDGLLHLPVKDTNSNLWDFINRASEAGAFTPDDIGITRQKDGEGYDVALTARGVHKLNQLALDGVKNDKGETIVPSLLSPEYTTKRENHRRDLRIEHVRKNMESALPGYIAKAPHDGFTYDAQAMQNALKKSHAMLNENTYWAALEKSQHASESNPIRSDLRTGLSDLGHLLATEKLTQPQLRWLVNESMYAPLLHDMGHLMTVAQDNPKKPGFDIGATEFQNAFGLSKLSMKPTSPDGKEASYYLRSQQGNTGFAEKVKNNAFMGLKPIIHSVDLAFEKPLLVGGAVAGIAAYSHVVPKKYSIPVMINKVVHDTMEGLGLHSHEKGVDIFQIAQKVKTFEKNQPFSFKSGFKGGWAACAGTLAAGFIVFNLVEDIIVHMPLALVSVGVGAAGGATGRKVVKPVIEDLGDILGKYAPEPVRQSFMSDWHTAKKFFENSPFKSAHDGFVAFSRDAEELGLVASTYGALQKSGKWADKIKHSTTHPTASL